MKIYIARPTRDRPYYFPTDKKQWKTEAVEIDEDELTGISDAMLNFHNAQARLAQLYHKIDKELYV